MRTFTRSRAAVWIAAAATAGALSGCLAATLETPSPGAPAPSTQAAGSPQTAGTGTSESPSIPTPGVLSRPAGVPDGAQPARVSRHVDGDTLWVEPLEYDQPVRLPLPEGATSRIRVLLIDTPETVHPTRGVECGGVEASAATAALLPVGALVWVLADTSDRDRYDRPLRYVFSADGTDLGAHLLEQGLAVVAHYPPDDLLLEQYRRIESDARARQVGVFGELCPAR